MKLIIENFKKFLEEEAIKEATEEEMEHLGQALNTPIEELPFSNIFGDKYRIIEKLSTVETGTIYSKVMDDLEKMGWSVAEPKGSSILCTKTRITHYIDGNGEPGVSTKAVTFNLPKVLSGIMKYMISSRVSLAEKAILITRTATSRRIENAQLNKGPLDPKYKYNFPKLSIFISLLI